MGAMQLSVMFVMLRELLQLSFPKMLPNGMIKENRVDEISLYTPVKLLAPYLDNNVIKLVLPVLTRRKRLPVLITWVLFGN